MKRMTAKSAAAVAGTPGLGRVALSLRYRASQDVAVESDMFFCYLPPPGAPAAAVLRVVGGRNAALRDGGSVALDVAAGLRDVAAGLRGEARHLRGAGHQRVLRIRCATVRERNDARQQFETAAQERDATLRKRGDAEGGWPRWQRNSTACAPQGEEALMDEADDAGDEDSTAGGLAVRPHAGDRQPIDAQRVVAGWAYPSSSSSDGARRAPSLRCIEVVEYSQRVLLKPRRGFCSSTKHAVSRPKRFATARRPPPP